MESVYFNSSMSMQGQEIIPSKRIEDDLELECETFLALRDHIGDTPLFIERCSKRQDLTHYERLLLESFEIDYQAHGELK